MRGHPIIILIISLLGIVVAYDINVTDLPQVGKSCQRGIDISFWFSYTNKRLFYIFFEKGGKSYCHRDVRFRLGPTNAKICNNGNIQTMRVPRDYPTLKVQGSEICPEPTTPPPPPTTTTTTTTTTPTTTTTTTTTTATTTTTTTTTAIVTRFYFYIFEAPC